MSGRVIQRSGPLRLAIVDGLDISDSRVGTRRKGSVEALHNVLEQRCYRSVPALTGIKPLARGRGLAKRRAACHSSIFGPRFTLGTVPGQGRRRECRSDPGSFDQGRTLDAVSRCKSCSDHR
jgi:hypothetical protein